MKVEEERRQRRKEEYLSDKFESLPVHLTRQLRSKTRVPRRSCLDQLVITAVTLPSLTLYNITREKRQHNTHYSECKRAKKKKKEQTDMYIPNQCTRHKNFIFTCTSRHF